MTDQALPEGVVAIGSRNYVTVAKRIQDFRADHPAKDGWGISTEVVVRNEGDVFMKATIHDKDGRVVATGYAREESINLDARLQYSIIEVCETSAVGRALAMAGFGGNFEVASADEMRKTEAKKNVISASRLKTIIDELLLAVEEDDTFAVQEIVEELDNDETLFVWQHLRSWEKTSIKKLLAKGREQEAAGEPVTDDAQDTIQSPKTVG